MCDGRERVTYVAFLQLGNSWSYRVDDTAELVSKNVVLLQRDDLPVIEMEIRATDGGSGNLQDDILVLRDSGDITLHDLDLVGPLPGESLHLSSGRVGLVFVLNDGARGGAHVALSGVGECLHCVRWYGELSEQEVPIDTGMNA